MSTKVEIIDFRQVGNIPPIECWGTPKQINWSGIQDNLIRLAAKYTDAYASDIIIDINAIQDKITNYDIEENGGDSLSRLIGFRENGVDHTEYVLSKDANELKNNHYRSIWRLDIKRHAEYHDSIQMSLYKVSYYSKQI